jgi:8-amino-7-oxononanoate synthase
MTIKKGFMATLESFCTESLKQLETAHARRQLRDAPAHTVSFASNDYFGLSKHPEVIAAAQAALVQYGAGAGASRLVTGNHPLYAPLEKKLAQLKKKEAALVFGSGYLANIGVITALMGKGDLILADKLAHACIIDGAQLSGAKLMRFKHNDAEHAIALLQEHRSSYENVLIITESVFSMDGDKAPLTALSKLARRHDAWLMVDDAHGLGEEAGTTVDIWTGTLSKAAGSYGGYAAGKQSLVDYLATSARSFIFSTGLPPATCASALKALEIAEREPQRRARPLLLARRVTNALGLVPAQSAIVPVIFGSSEAALAASARLEKLGILAIAIRPPTVPANSARLRLTFNSEHTDEQVDALIAALKTESLAA